MDLKKEIAQAVVIINDDENFEPLTLDQPKVCGKKIILVR